MVTLLCYCCLRGCAGGAAVSIWGPGGKGGGGPLLAAPALPGGATGRGWGSHISITDLGECLLPTGTSSSLRGSCEEGETNHGI